MLGQDCSCSKDSRWIFNLHSKLRSNMQILQYYIMNGLWYDEWASCHPPKTERVKQSGQGLSDIRNETQVYIFSTWYIPKKVKLLLHESKKLGSSKAKEEWRGARWRPPSHSSIQYSAARARPRCHAHSGVITDSYLHLGCSWGQRAGTGAAVNILNTTLKWLRERETGSQEQQKQLYEILWYDHK